MDTIKATLIFFTLLFSHSIFSAEITITPHSPSELDPISVRAFFPGAGNFVMTQGHEISGDTVRVWIFEDGGNFIPNPPHEGTEIIPPLAKGDYIFEIFAGPPGVSAEHFPISVREAPNVHPVPTITDWSLIMLGMFLLFSVRRHYGNAK